MRPNSIPAACWRAALAEYWATLVVRSQEADPGSTAPDPILARLADQLYQCLVAPHIPPEAARHVGQGLATLATSEPDLLGATHAWLVNHLLEPRADWASPVGRQRLFAALAALAIGFVEGWRTGGSTAQVEHQQPFVQTHRLLLQRIRHDRACLAAIVDAIEELVLALDTQGRVTMFNRAYERLTGYAATEIVGTYLWEHFLHPTDIVRVLQVFQTGQLSQIPSTCETNWTTRSGVARRISWTTTVLDEDAGPVTRVVCIGMVVCEQGRVANSVQAVQPKLAEPASRWRVHERQAGPRPQDRLCLRRPRPPDQGDPHLYRWRPEHGRDGHRPDRRDGLRCGGAGRAGRKRRTGASR